MPIATPIGTARYTRRESGLVARCTFGVADSAALLPRCETGQAWAVGNAGDAATLPTWGVTGGKGVAVALGTPNDPHAWIEAGIGDACRIGCDMGVATAASAGVTGLLFRRVDANNYLYARLNNSADTVTITRNLATVRSSIGTQAFTLADGQVVRMEVVLQGPRVAVFVNGAPLLAVTEANFVGATKHGLATLTAATGASWDNFEVRAT